jgi:hypothetical protein
MKVKLNKILFLTLYFGCVFFMRSLHEIINTGEPQSALKYHDQLIENLLDRDDHIICVLLLIKHTFIARCNATAIFYYNLVRMLVFDGKAFYSYILIFCDNNFIL